MKALRSGDGNPPKDKPSYLDVLMSLGPKAAMNAVKATIARNTHPFGYGGVDQQPIQRFINILQEPESESRADREALFERLGVEDDTGFIYEAQLEREDLLNMLMGFGGKLPKSEYREGAYRSPATEENLKALLRDPETREIMIEQMLQQPGYHDQGGGHGNVLGNFTVNRGSDERGEYIDYYDVWDLNPISSTMRARHSERATNAVRAAEDFLTRDVMGMKAPEVYGRIYLDELDGGVKAIKTKADRVAK